MGVPSLDQVSWAYVTPDPDDTTDPDLLTAGEWTIDSAELAVQVNDLVHVRICLEENAGNSTQSKNFQFYYDNDNTPSTATQATTTDSNIQIVDDGGTNDIPNASTVNTQRTNGGAGTWQDGEYIDTADDFSKMVLAGNYHTELQMYLQFLTSGTYYIFVRYNDTALGAHTQAVKIVVSAIKELASADCNAQSATAAGNNLSVDWKLTPSAVVAGQSAVPNIPYMDVDREIASADCDAVSNVPDIGFLYLDMAIVGTADGQSNVSDIAFMYLNMAIVGTADGQSNVPNTNMEMIWELVGDADGQSNVPDTEIDVTSGGEKLLASTDCNAVSNVPDISFLDITRPIVGTADGQSNVPDIAFMPLEMSIVGTADAQSSVPDVGYMEVEMGLASTDCAGQSDVPVSGLLVTWSLAGTVPGQSSAVNTMSLTWSLVSSVVAASGVPDSILTIQGIVDLASTDCNAQAGTGTIDISLTFELAGTADGLSNVPNTDLTLLGDVLLEGTVDATSNVPATDVSLVLPIVGTADGLSNVPDTVLGLEFELVGTADGQSDVPDLGLELDISLQGTVDAVSTVDGATIIDWSLAGTVNAVAGVDGTVVLEGGLGPMLASFLLLKARRR
jgi:hypothetical protein